MYTLRLPLAVFGSLVKIFCPLSLTTVRCTWMVRCLQSMSDQRNPQASPRRIPVASTSLKYTSYFMLCVSRAAISFRSEEHTSELQSRFDLVCRLLLEKN